MAWKVFDETLPVLTYEYSFGPGTANALAVGIDGGIAVVSPPLHPQAELFDELARYGPVKALFASNAFHYMGMPEWKARFPEAALFADAGANGEVGIHYVGPTWESESGSKVVGTAVTNAPSPSPTAIPWLLIRAVSTEGPGIFAETTYVQRINTVGGKAPATAGTTVGQVANVPYTAEYYFYRATQ